MKSTILYTRLSTRKQDIGEKVQIDRLISYCKSKGWDNYKIVKEKESGKTIFKREKFKKILEDIEKGKIKRLMIYKLDRLSRKLRHILDIVELLKSKDVDFVSINENFDTSSSSGMAFLQICGVFSELEGSIISERTKEALEKKKEQGVILGRPLGNYEYRTKKDRLREKVISLRKGRKSWREICQMLNIHFNTAKACLKSNK